MKTTAYVINLDRRPDRWARMQELWSEWFELVRWSAVDMPGKGAEGCKRSHVTLAESVLATEDMVIVLEDDAIPTKRFKEFGTLLLEEAQEHLEAWDYINCGPCLDPKFTGRTFTRISPARSGGFFWVDFSYRTHFVLYNRRSLPLLLATLDSETELDLHLGHNARNQWVPRHVLAVQAEGVSDIHKSPRELGEGYLTTENMLLAAQIKYSIMNKPCLACYLPPSTSPLITYVLCKQKLPVLLFSETDEYSELGHPVVKTKASPTIAGPGTNTLTFLTACLLAQRNGYSHLIYLTVDHLADADALWAAYVKAGKPHAVGGQLTICHAHAMTGHAVKDARELKAAHQVPEYGDKSSPPPHKPAVYARLAPAVYPLEMVNEMFKLAEGQTVETARKIPDAAHRLGQLLWEKYAGAVFDYVIHLGSGGAGNSTPTTIAPIRDEASATAESRPDLSSLTAPDTTVTPPTGVVPTPVIVASGEPKANTPEAGAVTPVDPEFVGTNLPLLPAQPGETPPVKKKRGQAKKVKPLTPEGQLVYETKINKFTYRMDILIVTCATEAEALAACLKSICKFCSDFGELVVVFPKDDEGIHVPIKDEAILPFDMRCSAYDPIEGKEEQQRMIQHCMADLHCPDADLILHLPANAVFTVPTGPQDFFHSGKPALLMTPYAGLLDRDAAKFARKELSELVLKEPVHYSTVEGQPVVHWREVYAGMRGFIEVRQNMKFADYVLAEPFHDFALLGAYVLRSREFIERYFFHNLARLPRPVPRIELTTTEPKETK